MDNNYGRLISVGTNSKYGYSVGDIVKYNKTTATKIHYKGEDLISIDETDVFCTVNKKL